MREIKFRGKSGNQWYYGDLEYNQRTLVARIHEYQEDGNYKGQHTVNPNTVGQFTGLHDKNGKEIYEGDILTTANKEGKPFGVVTWNSYGYFYIDDTLGKNNIREPQRVPIGQFVSAIIGGKPTDVEVIGNIHENKELLEQ